MTDPTPGEDWFLKRTMDKLTDKFWKHIYTGRVIPKKQLYTWLNRWWRLSKQDSREILRMLGRYPGIRYSNRGLTISKDYLDRAKTN